MSDQVKYLSSEWHALAEQALREQTTPEKMKNINTTNLHITRQCNVLHHAAIFIPGILSHSA